MKAILEIEAPESCSFCPLYYDVGTYSICRGNLKIMCGRDNLTIRHPNCPLQIIGNNTCQRCGEMTAARKYGLCHKCDRYIENYDCKKGGVRVNSGLLMMVIGSGLWVGAQIVKAVTQGMYNLAVSKSDTNDIDVHGGWVLLHIGIIAGLVFGLLSIIAGFAFMIVDAFKG